jgi:hypothetical protein
MTFVIFVRAGSHYLARQTFLVKGRFGQNVSRKGGLGKKHFPQGRNGAKAVGAFDHTKLAQMRTQMNHWPKSQIPNKCNIYWEFEYLIDKLF